MLERNVLTIRNLPPARSQRACHANNYFIPLLCLARFTNTVTISQWHVRVVGGSAFVGIVQTEFGVPDEGPFPVAHPEGNRPSTPCGCGRAGGEEPECKLSSCCTVVVVSRDADGGMTFTPIPLPFPHKLLFRRRSYNHSRRSAHPHAPPFTEGDAQRRAGAGAKPTPNFAVFCPCMYTYARCSHIH